MHIYLEVCKQMMLNSYCYVAIVKTIQLCAKNEIRLV